MSLFGPSSVSSYSLQCQCKELCVMIMMKSTLVLIVTFCFATSWADLSFSNGQTSINVLGQSGKIEFYLDANTSLK